MVVEITTKSVTSVDIESDEAFRVLCKTLNMDYVLNEDMKFGVEKDSHGRNYVYRIGNDGSFYKRYDDRGDLFIALRNVAVNMFPNLSFRSDDYIYKK